MPDRLDDQWAHNDYPVLVAIVRQIGSGGHLQPSGYPDFPDVDDLDAALQRLARHGYIEGPGSWGSGGVPIMITGVSERALRATGIWPSDEFSSASEDLIRFVETQVKTAPPEERGWWKRLRETLGDASQELTAKVIAEVVARQAGI